MPDAAFAEREARLVDHDVERIPALRAPADPAAESDVQRALTEGVRHPLEQQRPLAADLVHRRADALQVRGSPGSGDAVQLHARLFRRGASRHVRAPHMHRVASSGERACDGKAVVAHAAVRGRIFARDDVPRLHTRAPTQERPVMVLTLARTYGPSGASIRSVHIKAT